MSERTTLTGDGAWHNIGTGPATVQVISPEAQGISVMVVCSNTQPAGQDGLVLNGDTPAHTFQLADTIWAQVVQAGAQALVAVQPE